MFSVRFISVFLVNSRKFDSSAAPPNQLTFFASATAQSTVEKLGPDAMPYQVIHTELLFNLTITHCFGQEHIHFP